MEKDNIKYLVVYNYRFSAINRKNISQLCLKNIADALV